MLTRVDIVLDIYYCRCLEGCTGTSSVHGYFGNGNVFGLTAGDFESELQKYHRHRPATKARNPVSESARAFSQPCEMIPTIFSVDAARSTEATPPTALRSERVK